ncbi:hypothetical protein ACFQZI_04455 [Mucilaginibacter lutimaris]|uniref:Four helix bundle protein n=1 Tax=Mucilaginibacter lutimaris TaxID=931629 RepID=A0ABW2ZD33_9SPHI
MIIALGEHYIYEEVFNKFKEDCEECLKMINGYIKYLRSQALIQK